MTNADLICPTDIVDPETGELYFAKGERLTEEKLAERLANAYLLKKRSHSLSRTYDALKALYSEWVAHHDAIRHEGYAAQLKSAGTEKQFDLVTLANDHHEQILRMAREGMLQVRTNRVKDALNLPFVRNYMDERPRSQRIDIDKEE